MTIYLWSALGENLAHVPPRHIQPIRSQPVKHSWKQEVVANDTAAVEVDDDGERGNFSVGFQIYHRSLPSLEKGICRCRFDLRDRWRSLKMMDAVDQTTRTKDDAAYFSTIHDLLESDLKKKPSDRVRSAIIIVVSDEITDSPDGEESEDEHRNWCSSGVLNLLYMLSLG
ncbi:hypothetical protein ACLOJK_011027 [Asimina triloba]